VAELVLVRCLCALFALSPLTSLVTVTASLTSGIFFRLLPRM
jgi:hypothetical protein